MLVVRPEQVDLLRVEQLGEQGGRALGAGDPETAARKLREALGLWRGPALSEFTSSPSRKVRSPASRS